MTFTFFTPHFDSNPIYLMRVMLRPKWRMRKLMLISVALFAFISSHFLMLLASVAKRRNCNFHLSELEHEKSSRDDFHLEEKGIKEKSPAETLQRLGSGKKKRKESQHIWKAFLISKREKKARQTEEKIHCWDVISFFTTR